MGLERALALAQQRGVTIETICCDLADFQPEAQSTDLVVAIWMQTPWNIWK